MTTEKLYYQNSHLKEFNAAVVSCSHGVESFAVILDKTAFFPEGGGQYADTGFIGDSKVLNVLEKDGEIIHCVDAPLEVGKSYDCKLDWEKRFSRMQNHSGEHIVSGIVHKMYGYDNVGFHLGENIVTIDFNGELTREQLTEIETLANKAVCKNLKITTIFPSADELAKYDYRSKLELSEDVRLVEIDGVDLCACCAPHVDLTGEIGVIKLLDFSRHRGGIRLFMKAGMYALDDYRDKYKNVLEISNLLSVKQEQTAEAVVRLQDELYAANRAFSEYKLSLVEKDKERLDYIGDFAYYITNNYDSDMMRELVNFAKTRIKAVAAVFSGNDKDGYSYVAGTLGSDINAFAKTLNSALSGRGGGRDGMVQGKVSVTKKEIAEFFSKIKELIYYD